MVVSVCVRMVVVGFTLLLSVQTVMAETPLMFVAEYNKLLEADKVKLGEDYRVEGRITSIAPNLLKLQQCAQIFRPAKGEAFGKSPDDRGVAEVFGQVQVQDRKRVFVVSTLRFLRDDLVSYELKKNGVRNGKAEDWYELAAWAGTRAEFYDDDALRAKQAEANLRGIELERQGLARVDADALLALAEKGKDLKLPENLRQEFVHEAHRLSWTALQKEKRPNLQPLLDAIKRDLPGAEERLPTPQPDLEGAYRKNPLAVYGSADEKARQKLHRIFFSDVMLAAIERQAEKEGLSGFTVADRIAEVLPERPSVAEQHRERELNDRLKNVDRLTRPEMLDLADRFRGRNRPEEAEQVVKNWLKATEEQARKEGPAGLMRAADEYIDLLEDREKGAELLKEAYKLSPESERIAERLTQLDYRLQGEEWVPAREIEGQPLDPLQQAIRNGQVVAGMTAAQVRASLGAATSVTRTATAGQLSELWVYGRPNETRITVHLLRRTPRSPLTALEVGQIAPR